jgi:hypothetical protein
MVFDRITLISIYERLKSVQDNDGIVSNILLNRNSKYGTKTVPRFKDLTALKYFINEKYPYVISNECTCLTENESIWNLLAFEIYSRPEDLSVDLIAENNKRKYIGIQPISKHAIFVNNIRGAYQSQKSSFQNNITAKKIDSIFATNKDLQLLFQSYICNTYIENQSNYINPCDYIELTKNESYNILISKYYKPTRTSEFPNQISKF